MAKKAQRAVEEFAYTPKADLALSDEQSRFRFRPLTQSERLNALDTSEKIVVDGGGERSVQPRGFAQARELVLLTLVSTDNFPAGEPVDYPAMKSHAEKSNYLEMVDDILLFELGNYVFSRSALGEPEKNS